MKIVHFVSLVDARKCNGDKLCERLCPAGAIKVVEKKARVDETRCVACGKCADVCREEAVCLVRRFTPKTLTFDVSEVDAGQIQELCMKASLMPDLLVCACTKTLAGEVAAAILGGAKSPEDVVVMTGAGSGCGIYCMGVIFKLFAAAGIRIPEDCRWNSLPLTAADLPADLAEKFPQYHFGGRI
jgi:ferredoxin